MSPKRIPLKSASRESYGDRWKKALERRSAMEREEAAGAFDPAPVLAVQGVIAAADALSILHRGVRAASDRHEDALAVLSRLPIPGIDDAVGHLARLLREKGELEYGVRTPKPAEIAALLQHARRFFDFAGRHLPPDRSG